MTLADIDNLINNMTSPNAVIKYGDVTGLYFEVFLYGMIAVLIFATGESESYNRFSKRVAISSFLPFVIGSSLFAATLINYTVYLRLVVSLVLSIIYLYMDDIYK